MLAGQSPEQILDAALLALSSEPDWRLVLDALPCPIYTTDSTGHLTYWNSACVEFAGREPELGRDRWCVSWKMHTTAGEPMPHEQCPTATAIRSRQSVRDLIAIAERPDGSRRAFRPYPTPLFDDSGIMTGAINLMVDVTEEQSEALHHEAERCRRLACATYNRRTATILSDMAAGFERTAGDLTRAVPVAP